MKRGKLTALALTMLAICMFLLGGCQSGPEIIPITEFSADRTPRPTATPAPDLTDLPTGQSTDENSDTLHGRFKVPYGYERVEVGVQTFDDFLRNLPLKEAGSTLVLFDGTAKLDTSYDAIVDYTVGSKDHERVADTLIHLRAQYLYEQGLYDQIKFTFSDGFECSFGKWRLGYTVAIEDQKAVWEEDSSNDDSPESFSRYLSSVFAYANLSTLMEDLDQVDGTSPLAIGDVLLLTDDTVDHCLIIADICKNADGDTLVLVVQGGTNAQPPEVERNESDITLSPWFRVDTVNGGLTTPVASFSLSEDRFRFKGSSPSISDPSTADPTEGDSGNE